MSSTVVRSIILLVASVAMGTWEVNGAHTAWFVLLTLIAVSAFAAGYGMTNAEAGLRSWPATIIGSVALMVALALVAVVVRSWAGPAEAATWAWAFARAGAWTEALPMARVATLAFSGMSAGFGALLGGVLVGRAVAKSEIALWDVKNRQNYCLQRY